VFICLLLRFYDVLLLFPMLPLVSSLTNQKRRKEKSYIMPRKIDVCVHVVVSDAYDDGCDV
jgi:hypothetical protein